MRRKFNVVFLDFDGVLNSTTFFQARPDQEYDDIDSKSVAVLNGLLSRMVDPAVVISSTWRHGRKRTELCDILNDHGFTGGVVAGVTPILYGPQYRRGNEIQQWLDETLHDVSSFVILDDDSDMAHLMPRLVRTDRQVGLTVEDVEKALSVLKEPYVRPEPKSV